MDPPIDDAAAAPDSPRLGRSQLGVLLLCASAVLMDGFDVQALAAVAPALLQDWAISRASLGPVFGAGLFGMLIGSLAFGALADRIGRRPVLIGSLAGFGACSLATAQAASVNELLMLRLFTGIGLGALMPNALALAAEYSPRRSSATVTILVSGAFVAGAALGGLAAALLLPRFGWPSIFVAGAAGPFVLAALMLRWLPESTQFLRCREEASPAGSVAQLFRDGMAAGTGVLWAFNFLNLLTVFFLSSWLPSLVADLGWAPSRAALAGAALQAGGLVGTLTLGRFVDRFGIAAVLGAAFLCGALAIASIGQPAPPPPLRFVLIALAGCAVFGAQGVLNAWAARYYPTPVRATGLGWSLGVGRLGAIVGPVVGGELLRQDASNAALFLCAATPPLACALAVPALRRMMAMSQDFNTPPDRDGEMGTRSARPPPP